METLTLDDGLTLAYRRDGNPGGPPLVFSNSLGTDHTMWDGHLAALGDSFRLVRYDTRGHGRSGVPAEPASLARLGNDLVALLDHLGLARAHVCGVSLGGVTAQWLAVTHPERVDRLVLSNTGARVGSVASWQARIDAVGAGGLAAIEALVLGRFFSPAFTAAQPATVERFRATLLATDPAGYTVCCAALREADLRPAVATIATPTLIVAGELDESTRPALAEELHRAIAGSELLVLAGAAHLANVEAPELFDGALRRFLLS